MQVLQRPAGALELNSIPARYLPSSAASVEPGHWPLAMVLNVPACPSVRVSPGTTAGHRVESLFLALL